MTPPTGNGPARLVADPVFIFSSVRSGSTLLRAMLDRHPQICAPHELHLKDIDVRLSGDFAEHSMHELGLDAAELQHMLWDRLIHRLLTRSGKRIFVNKTPTDAFIWDRIAQCWPGARFLFLLRHPASIAASWDQAQIHWTYDQAVEDTLRYVTAVEEARSHLPGVTLRYEELTAAPEQQMRRVCDFLRVDWEPEMLQYGGGPSKPAFHAGLGDWSPKIHSGRPQPTRPLPAQADIPEALMPACKAWGYN